MSSRLYMNEVAVLVVSCDNYSDLWGPFFGIFRKRWPDCPYPLFLGSNYKMFSSDGVASIQVGEDVSWADNLQRMLDRTPFPRIILLLEDFLLTKPVDTELVRSLAKLAIGKDLSCLRLFPHPPPTRRLRKMPGVGELRRGDQYRVSTQAAIWDVNMLRSLARPGFSAWDFELIGSLLSNDFPGTFWGTYEPAIHYRHGVLQGKWLPLGLSICAEAGVEVDLGTRPVLNPPGLSAKAGTKNLSLRGITRQIVPASWVKAGRRWLRLWRGRKYMEQLLKKSGLSLDRESL